MLRQQVEQAHELADFRAICVGLRSRRRRPQLSNAVPFVLVQALSFRLLHGQSLEEFGRFPREKTSLGRPPSSDEHFK
jgi:hypothetical protein